MSEASGAGGHVLPGGRPMNYPPTWEVTLEAPGFDMQRPLISVTSARPRPGDAVTALWTALESIPETQEFLRHVTNIRVKRIQV